MFKITIPATLFLSLFFIGCSSTSSLTKQTDKAKQAFATGDFENAFTLYTTFIEQQKSVNKELSGEVYSAAAKSAFKVDKLKISESFFKEAYYKEYADADMYANMISIYRSIDNLSKEIDALEYFTQHYSTDPRFVNLNIRLLETYIESENWDKALAMWTAFNVETQSDIKVMELYLTAQKELGNYSVADKLATDILKKNSGSKVALERMAEKYFWRAETRYQVEMDAYEKKKTNKQYSIMLKALDVITVDFKKALGYYEKLYKNYPSKEYAKQMANIYVRFQDKKKSDYYRRLSK
jgi:tetratricopeptide (TPR) repeat protein